MISPFEALIAGIAIGYVSMGIIGPKFRNWEWVRKRFNIQD